ncbi:MAG: hypothetical protein LCH80_12900 [Proteobacteria bacterium]|nr:hypothetical protein [Pseudomonadota bacterium]
MATAEAYQDGVRATFTLFFIDDNSGIETEVAAKHVRFPLDDLAHFIASSRTILDRMMPDANWRLMTAAEVDGYLDRQAEEKSGSYLVEEGC